jgi:hypothetical protein
MLTGQKVQRNFGATAGLAWSVWSRRSHGSRAQRPSGRFEQRDREQSLVSRPPSDGWPAPAQPGVTREQRAPLETEEPEARTLSASGDQVIVLNGSALLRIEVASIERFQAHRRLSG